jgi:hypothetical protein
MEMLTLDAETTVGDVMKITERPRATAARWLNKARKELTASESKRTSQDADQGDQGSQDSQDVDQQSDQEDQPQVKPYYFPAHELKEGERTQLSGLVDEGVTFLKNRYSNKQASQIADQDDQQDDQDEDDSAYEAAI